MFEKFRKIFKAKSISLTPPIGWTRILEPFSGAWQNNVEWRRNSVLSYHAIFACITLIASDIAKLRMFYYQNTADIWIKAAKNPYFFIENPNNYQNRIQFFENWITSKLTRGNTYVLKERDTTGKVRSLYILCPDLVLPLITPAGDVFYRLSYDNLSGIPTEGLVVPASEIIHDRFNCLFHPLIGLPPIFASFLAAFNGEKIQENSSKFFSNMSRPSGILTAPGAISEDTAKRLKETWETNYGGDNVGKMAVLGDGLKYESIAVAPVDAQMVEQLKLSAEIVCSTFHVPSYKVIGNSPSFNNIEMLEQGYHNQCLQKLIEDVEICLANGLDLKENVALKFNIDDLLRMNNAAVYEANTKGVSGGWLKPDEARKRANLPAVAGGDTPYLQQQNYSLAALAKRDAQANPFATSGAQVNNAPIDPNAAKDMKEFVAILEKELKEALHA